MSQKQETSMRTVGWKVRRRIESEIGGRSDIRHVAQEVRVFESNKFAFPKPSLSTLIPLVSYQDLLRHVSAELILLHLSLRASLFVFVSDFCSCQYWRAA